MKNFCLKPLQTKDTFGFNGSAVKNFCLKPLQTKNTFGFNGGAVKNFCLKPLQTKKGLALIMVLSGLVLIVSLIQETIFETQVEYRLAVREMHSLKAYYAAKAGMELSLLRTKTYHFIIKNYGDKAKVLRPYIDLVWKAPFSWPPLLSDTEEEEEKETASLLQGLNYSTNISATAGKLDLNDLASPIPSLRKWTYLILYRLIYQLYEEQPEFNEGQIKDIINNIKDWVDPDSLAGEFSSAPESFNSENSSAETAAVYPPNRSFISLTELNQVPGVTAGLYKKLQPFVTVHGEKGLNINTAPPELLQSLHDDFPQELAQEIFDMTSSMTVFSKESFSELLNTRGLNYLAQDLLQNKEQSAYLIFDAPRNFEITSTGIFQKAVKNITVFYFDFSALSSRFMNLLKQDIQQEAQNHQGQNQPVQQSQAGASPQPPPTQNSKAQAPTIIYWKEH